MARERWSPALRFVDLTTTADPDATIGPRLEWARRGHQQRYLDAQPEKIALLTIPERFERAVLLGEPGSGKSTCLRQLALTMLDHVQQSRPSNAAANGEGSTEPVLPLYVSLSDWSDPSMGAREFLRRQLQDLVGEANFYSRNFETLLTTGRFVFLLDGLNELPGRRASVREGAHERSSNQTISSIPTGRAAWVGGSIEVMQLHASVSVDNREQWLRQFADTTAARSRFVLSCRSHEYFDSMSWQITRVLPMSANQVSRFVDSYLPSSDAAGLREMLSRNTTLRAIATNPFFLRSIVEIYSPGLDEVSNRGEVLRYLFEQLLQRERQGERAAEIIRVVGQRAFRMLGRGHIGNLVPLENIGPKELEAVQTLADTGLLLGRDHQFFFYHQIVQEFLAAYALKERCVHRQPATLLADKRWSEVVALWLDLDETHVSRRLRKALGAFDLPWRRPRSKPSGFLAGYQTATGVAAFLIISAYAFDWLLWPVKALPLPFTVIPLIAIEIAVIAVVLRMPLSYLDRHRSIISNCTYVLAERDQRWAIPNIISAFKHVWQLERAEMAQSLTIFGEVVVGHAIKGLVSKQWRIRAGCVQTLGEIARNSKQLDSRVVDALLSVAASDDPQLGQPAIDALRYCHDERALRAIAQLVDRSRDWSPLMVAYRLRTLGEPSRIGSVEWNQETIHKFQELADKVQPNMVRMFTLRAMGALRVPGSESLLFEVASDSSEDDQIRQHALTGLGLLQSPDAVDRLEELARTAFHDDMRAEKEIQGMRDPSAFAGLARAAESEAWTVRAAAATAIGRVGSGDSALQVLRRLSSDNDEDVRAAAAKSIGAIGVSEAVATLSELTRDPNASVRRAAFDSLVNDFPDLAAEPLIAIAVDPNAKDRLRAIRLLGRRADSKAEEALHSLTGATDDEIRDAAKESLAQARAFRRGSLGAGWRHKPFAAVRSYVMKKLQIDGLRAMFREEAERGTSSYAIVSKVQSNIMSDAELSRKYRVTFRVWNASVNVMMVLLGLILVLVLRLALSATITIVGVWLPFALIVLSSLVTFMPGVRRLRDVAYIKIVVILLRWLSLLIVAVCLVGAIIYTWWTWLALLFALIFTLLLIEARRRAHRTMQIVATTETEV